MREYHINVFNAASDQIKQIISDLASVTMDTVDGAELRVTIAPAMTKLAEAHELLDNYCKKTGKGKEQK